MPRFTVLGGRGFVGSNLVDELRGRGHDVRVPDREWEPAADDYVEDLGIVIYAIGLTADFRRTPLAAIEAHVSKLTRVLEHGSFDRLVYLSSARIYGTGSTLETANIATHPYDLERLYDLSKLLGESAAIHSGHDVRIARLSNVYGADWRSENFITALLRDAVELQHVILRSDPQSAKDFVSIEDVTRAIIDIAQRGRELIYNVASGENTTYETIVDTLCSELGATWEAAEDAPRHQATTISVARLVDEFGYAPRSLIAHLRPIASAFALAGTT